MSTHIMNKPQFLVGGALAATVHIAAKAPPTEIASATEARP